MTREVHEPKPSNVFIAFLLPSLQRKIRYEIETIIINRK